MKMKNWLKKYFGKPALSRFYKRYGALTAGLVCAGIVGIVYAVTWNGGQVPAPGPSPSATQAERMSGSNLDEQLGDIAATKTPQPAATPAATARAGQTVAEAGSSPIPKMLRPLEGKVILEFARDSLVYSETLRQWSTHMGVDIEADEGADVAAVLDGVVESVAEDEAMGICVTLGHGNGMRSVYCSLERTDVTKGKALRRGDVIGQAGNTATCELLSGDHLHFEFYLGDTPVNAAPFFVDR